MQTVQCELISKAREEIYNQVKGRSLRISASSTDHTIAASTSTRTQPWLVPLECITRLFPVGTGLGEKCTPGVLKARGEEARLGTRPGSKVYFSPASVQGQVCAGDVRCTGDISQQVHLPSPTNDLIIRSQQRPEVGKVTPGSLPLGVSSQRFVTPLWFPGLLD